MSEGSTDFEARVERAGTDATVVRVAGELDLATVGALEEALRDVDRSGPAVIDLSGCTFLDSSAVRVLVATARATQEAGGTLSLVAADPAVLRVLEIAAIDTVVPVHPTLDAAL